MPPPPSRFSSLCLSCTLLALFTTKGAAATREARVISDEIVTTTTPAHNGSSPMWSVGAPMLVRENGNVWASISVHDPEAVPYCNTHWELWRRPSEGRWSRVRAGHAASEREPCPLVLLDPETLVLSIHPKILDRGREASGETRWHCQPALAAFDLKRPDSAARLWRPAMDPPARFTQHSYRSVGVDSSIGSLLMMVIDHEDTFHTAWRDSAGGWHTVYPPVFPIRACYPNVGFRNGAGHILAIGDIKEPNEVWRAAKHSVLGQDWDYVFRRLFYTWMPDVASGRFGGPLEIDTVEGTAGWMFNLDLAIDAQGRVHLLWVRRTFDHGFLGERFFPGGSNVESVMHAVVDRGRVIAQEQIARREVPLQPPGDRHFTSGRLHELPDGRLVAVLISPTPGDEFGLFLQELDLSAKASALPIHLPLVRPPPHGFFFTNASRGGSAPSQDLDLLAAEPHGDAIALRYIHVYIP